MDPFVEHMPDIEHIPVVEHISIIEHIPVIEHISIIEHISVLETRETREKTQTRIFRAGSGQVSIKTFSGFSCHALEKPESSGRGRVQIFSGFCTLYSYLSLAL